MTIPDTDHPWIQAMRRQRRWTIASIALCSVIPIGMIGLVLLLFQPGVGLPNITWLLVGGVVMLGMPIAVMSILARKQRRWIECMLQCDGLLCPKCCIALNVSENQQSLECEKCARTYDRVELRRYWEGLVTDPMRAGTWWVRNYGTGWRATWVKWVWRDGRLQVMPFLLGNAVIWLVAGLVLAAFTRESLLMSAFKYGHMFLFMSGFMLFTIAGKTRVGDARFCAKCGYERGPENQPSPRCPECGFNWNTFAGTVTGKREPNRRMMIAGGVMAALGIAFMFTPFLGSWQFRLLPTGPLIHQAVNKASFTGDEWTQLRKRALTPDQQRRLASGLLNDRSYFSADEDNWFVAEITAGTLPDDLKQRYYREMLKVDLIAPATAKVGEPVTLKLQFTNRGAGTNNPQGEALIGGYYIGEEPEPIARQAVGIPGIMFHAPQTSGFTIPDTDGTFVPQRADALKVRAKVWVIAVAIGRGSQPIQWQADGSPVIPANSIWHEMRELETTIVVE